MLVTDLNHIEQQIATTPSLKKAIEFLKRPDLESLPDGRVEVDGDRVFALPQRYDTIVADTPRFEYHRTYIDIQFIVSGEEIIGWAPVERMAAGEAYDPKKDIAFGTVKPNEITPVFLRAGQMAVLYPEDGHAPRLAAGTPSAVHKIVMKVAV